MRSKGEVSSGVVALDYDIILRLRLPSQPRGEVDRGARAQIEARLALLAELAQPVVAHPVGQRARKVALLIEHDPSHVRLLRAAPRDLPVANPRGHVVQRHAGADVGRVKSVRHLKGDDVKGGSRRVGFAF